MSSRAKNATICQDFRSKQNERINQKQKKKIHHDTVARIMNHIQPIKTKVPTILYQPYKAIFAFPVLPTLSPLPLLSITDDRKHNPDSFVL